MHPAKKYGITMFHKNSKAINLTIDDQTYIACKKLVSGGSKQIFDLGNGYVIGLTFAPLDVLHRFIDMEVSLSKKLLNLGLRTQEYEKVTANINGNSRPVLKMPHFSKLAQDGLQVRDRKNNLSSCGDSRIFGSVSNLTDANHWRVILKDIAHDIAVYLLNHFDFRSDAFNLAIENTQATTCVRDTCKSVVFSDLQQSIRLYFFDFNDLNSFYHENINYDFLDLDGEDGQSMANTENITSCINRLKTQILNTVFLAVSEVEYDEMMSAHTDDYGSYFTSTTTMTKLSNDAFQTAWDALVINVREEMICCINKLSETERQTLYATTFFKTRLEIIEERKRYLRTGF